MKEFSFQFKEGLVKGLRTDFRNPRNSQALVEALNCKARPEGIRSYVPVSNPFTYPAGKSDSWPYPQIFYGTTGMYACWDDSIYNVSTVDYSMTLGTTVTSGGIWSFADFGEYVVFTNGSEIAYYDGTAWGSFADPQPDKVNALCNFKGQLIVGGLPTTWNDCNSNFVAWSKIGDVTITPDMVNTSGYAPMLWDGSVLNVKRIGDFVMVYGSGGINYLFPTSRPITTFGIGNVASFGIAGAGAVCGTDTIHYFVDEMGQLWRTTLQTSARATYPAIEFVGYKEFLEGMLGSDIMMSIDPNQGEAIISNNEEAFYHSGAGLTEIGQLITSSAFINGTLIGASQSMFDESFLIVSDVIDLNLRGFKTIGVIELAASNPEIMQVAIDWRVNPSATWRRSAWKRVSPKGVVFMNVSGVDFRICVKADTYEDMDLDYITVRFKVVDKTSVRGEYASKATA